VSNRQKKLFRYNVRLNGNIEAARAGGGLAAAYDRHYRCILWVCKIPYVNRKFLNSNFNEKFGAEFLTSYF